MEERLARAMAVVHEFVDGSADLEATLQELTSLASASVGAAMAGLTIRDERGRATTVVYTDDAVPAIDQAQYDADRGPCLDAARTQMTMQIDDIVADRRWPEFAAAAAAHGIRSSLAVPVVAAGDGLGALNLYARQPAQFGEGERQAGGLFAGQCAIAGMYWRVAKEATGLARAMETRAVIEQAKGILMATTGCSADDAFGLLREQSQRENRKLWEIAREIADRQKR